MHISVCILLLFVITIHYNVILFMERTYVSVYCIVNTILYNAKFIRKNFDEFNTICQKFPPANFMLYKIL